jgi:hypothetical protein
MVREVHIANKQSTLQIDSNISHLILHTLGKHLILEALGGATLL